MVDRYWAAISRPAILAEAIGKHTADSDVDLTFQRSEDPRMTKNIWPISIEERISTLTIIYWAGWATSSWHWQESL